MIVTWWQECNTLWDTAPMALSQKTLSITGHWACGKSLVTTNNYHDDWAMLNITSCVWIIWVFAIGHHYHTPNCRSRIPTDESNFEEFSWKKHRGFSKRTKPIMTPNNGIHFPEKPFWEDIGDQSLQTLPHHITRCSANSKSWLKVTSSCIAQNPKQYTTLHCWLLVTVVFCDCRSSTALRSPNSRHPVQYSDQSDPKCLKFGTTTHPHTLTLTNGLSSVSVSVQFLEMFGVDSPPISSSFPCPHAHLNRHFASADCNTHTHILLSYIII